MPPRKNGSMPASPFVNSCVISPKLGPNQGCIVGIISMSLCDWTCSIADFELPCPACGSKASSFALNNISYNCRIPLALRVLRSVMGYFASTNPHSRENYFQHFGCMHFAIGKVQIFLHLDVTGLQKYSLLRHSSRVESGSQLQHSFPW